MSEIDKPVFVIGADEPMSAPFVRMWACFINGDLPGALDQFNGISQDILPEYEADLAPIEVVNALTQLADAMEKWGKE